MPPDTPVWIQTLSAVAQSIIALATLLLSVVLVHISRQHARVEYTRSVQESWNNLNLAILSDPSIANIADSLFKFPPSKGNNEARQKRYLGFLCLNIIEAAYLGHRAGLVEKSYHLEAISHILNPLLKDDEIVELLQVGGYDADFVAFCKKTLKSQSNSRTDSS